MHIKIIDFFRRLFSSSDRDKGDLVKPVLFWLLEVFIGWSDYFKDYDGSESWFAFGNSTNVAVVGSLFKEKLSLPILLNALIASSFRLLARSHFGLSGANKII